MAERTQSSVPIAAPLGEEGGLADLCADIALESLRRRVESVHSGG